MASDCASSDRYVMLRGGLAIPVAPLRLLLELEARGCRLWRDGSTLVVEPRHLISEDDRHAIRHWKAHLLALLDYQPDEVPS